MDEAGDVREALRLWDARRPDLILLDLGLPDLDGQAVIRRVRREATTPIIVVSARGREEDRVAALDAGADDYLTKPFGLSELHARMRAVLRRAAGPEADVEGRLRLGPGRRSTCRATRSRVGETPVELTPREFELLKVAALAAGPSRDRGPAAARGLGHGLLGRGALPPRLRLAAAPQAGRRRPVGRRRAS